MEAKRERYTPNDVGSSPLEWEAPRLSEISTLITNGFVGTATPFYSDNTGVPYLYGTNVRANKLDIDKVRYITHDFHAKQSKTELKAGDLLTVQSGHIGETAVVPKQFEGSNCHALIVTRLKQNKAHPTYMSYYLNSEVGRARMRGLEVGSTILHINTKDLKKFRVLLPSLPEQKKIAQILSTWDKAITTTEQLLANSQQQKKALMQQLLTGKKRLLDENGVRFSGEWGSLQVKDIGKVITGSTPPKNDLNNYGADISWATAEDFRGKYVSDTKVKLSSQGAHKSRLVPKGSVLVTCIASIGKNAIANEVMGTNQQINAVVVNNENSNEFFYYQIEFNVSKLRRLAGTTAVPILNKSSFEKVRLKLPLVKEQGKIASVLSVIDEEVSKLQQKLEALKQEKKALMQQLLTGKRRVKVDEEAA